jgi:hypothetical protein
MMHRITSRLICVAWAIHAIPAARADDVPANPVDGTISWLYSYEEGKQLARDSGKPMLVVFRCER